MLDFASYINNQRLPDKRGVSVKRDIDWWMDFFAQKLAKATFLLLLALILLGIKLLAQTSKDANRFPVNHIALRGEIKITTPNHVAEALNALDEQSFYAVDVTEVADRLRDLPWIQDAFVERAWPDQLTVNLSEHQASYQWGEDYLLDESGNRFPHNQQAYFKTLPMLFGPDGFEQTVIEAYETYKKTLIAHGLDLQAIPVTQLILTPYLSWELHLDDKVVVKFGRDQFDARIARFVQAYDAQKVPDLDKIMTLDFRYRSGFAVKWLPLHAPNTDNTDLIEAAQTEI